MRSKSATKIWFELLKLSIEMGLPINRDFYERWGTEQEIKNLHFNTWWRTKGKALFEAASPKVSLAEKKRKLSCDQSSFVSDCHRSEKTSERPDLQNTRNKASDC